MHIINNVKQEIKKQRRQQITRTNTALLPFSLLSQLIHQLPHHIAFTFRDADSGISSHLSWFPDVQQSLHRCGPSHYWLDRQRGLFCGSLRQSCGHSASLRWRPLCHLQLHRICDRVLCPLRRWSGDHNGECFKRAEISKHAKFCERCQYNPRPEAFGNSQTGTAVR